MNIGGWIARVRALSTRTQIVLGAAAVCVVVGVFAAAFVARDTRVALFAGAMQADQLAEIEERLAAWNVPFVATGDNVRVDAARRNDLLLRLAVAGLPHPHLAATTEALGKAGALTPQSVLEAQERDGLAADLALALRGIAGVLDARVIIAPARNGTYADERDAPATASVRLTLAPGTRLEAARVAAIASFVANGVPGLAPERVALLDDRGDALGATDATPGAAEIETALQTAIDGAFGSGAAIVRVRVERDERALSVRETDRRPFGSGTIAREASDERFATDKRRYAKTTTTEDRGSAVREERSESAPGRIARVSVAVVVDSARTLDFAAIRALADATAGIDRKRGDVVTVTPVRFARALPLQQTTGVPWLAFAAVAPQAATIALFLVVAAVAGRPAARLVVRAVERAELRAASAAVAGAPPHHVRGALAGEPPHTAAAIISALPAATAAAVLELYPPEERAAIVRRLSRARSPLANEVDPFAFVEARRA
jgi:flagellar M-ring protein FliF